jgi:hypothetical protein
MIDNLFVILIDAFVFVVSVVSAVAITALSMKGLCLLLFMDGSRKSIE